MAHSPQILAFYLLTIEARLKLRIKKLRLASALFKMQPRLAVVAIVIQKLFLEPSALATIINDWLLIVGSILSR